MTVRLRSVVLILGTLGLAAAAALALLGHRCAAAGGRFHWSSVTCAQERPIILQGDIHRV